MHREVFRPWKRPSSGRQRMHPSGVEAGDVVAACELTPFLRPFLPGFGLTTLTRFAVSLENGNLQVWDWRFNAQAEIKIVAHNKTVG